MIFFKAMLKINGLKKSYNNVPLLDNISFSIESNEIVGLVGRNGCGKSTLLKMILGLESQDDGTIEIPRDYELGYLDQHIHFTKPTLLEECCQALSEDEQYDFYKAEKILFGLGFIESDLEKPPTSFSGGFQLRINLTKTLLKNPDMLLLDEPTNYLDILSLRWLRRFLKNFRGEVIMITHDREFLDTVTTHTMGIHRGKLLKILGSTDKYYDLLTQSEDQHEKNRQNQEKKIKDLQKFADKFRAKASKATQAQSKLRQIEKMKVLDKLAPEYTLGFRFNFDPTPAKILLRAEDISFSYTGNANDNLFSDLSFEVRPGDRLAVIGKNGKGKTTLLNVLSNSAEPSDGTIKLHPRTSIGYYQQTNRKDLNPNNTIAEEIAESRPELTISESRAICGAMMFSKDLADKKISVLSGGEQSRVLLGKTLARPANLLLLDEPSNHLDMDSITVMTREIEKFKGGVILVTHNEEMLRVLANKLIIFRSDSAEVFLGTYNEFLEEIGWEEEASLKKNKKKQKQPKEKSHNNKKELSKELKSLKKEFIKTEAEIIALEDDINIKNEEALDMLKEKAADGAIRKLYSKISIAQNKVDESYKKTDELSKQIDELETLLK